MGLKSRLQGALGRENRRAERGEALGVAPYIPHCGGGLSRDAIRCASGKRLALGLPPSPTSRVKVPHRSGGCRGPPHEPLSSGRSTARRLQPVLALPPAALYHAGGNCLASL